MSLTITPGAQNKFSTILVSYGDKEIKFNVQSFDRSNVLDPTRSMSPLNRYLATLPDERQRNIFNVFAAMREAFDDVRTWKRLSKKLRLLISQLYDEIDIDRMFQWLTLHLDIQAGEVNAEYSADDGPRELTYIREEYKGLVRLGVVLKPLLPIVGEYMSTIAKDVGTAYKEYRTMDLMDARIIDRPEWQRLAVYVEVNSSYSRKNTSAVYGSLGTEELPEWLLAFAVIRKVMLIDPNDGSEHIVRKMYNYLKSKMDQIDKSFTRVDDKHRPTENGREEDNISIMENTRVRQEISRRVPKDVEFYVNNHLMEFAELIQPGIDKGLVRECVSNIARTNIVINEVHYMLCGPLIIESFSAKALYLIPHVPMCKILGLVQAVLYTRGFYTMAYLCSAKFLGRDPGEFSLGGEGQVKSRISRADLEVLSGIYPHYRRTSVKDLTAKNNVGSDWVDELLNKLSSVDIEYNLPKRLDTEQRNGTRLIIPSNLRPDAARFLMDLNEHYRNNTVVNS